MKPPESPSPAAARQPTPAVLAAWALTLVLPLAVFSQAAPRLSAPAALLVALMVGAAVQWAFRLVPDFVVGLLLLWLCVLLGLAPPEMAFGGFASPLFLLVLGVFLLAAQLAESPWMARWTAALLRHTQGRPAGRLAAVVLSALVLTLALPSPLGRSALLAPLLPALAAGRSPRTQTAMVFALGQGNTVWSTVFLTGNPLNFVLLGLLDLQSQQRFQWLHWLWAAAAFGLVVSAGLAVLLAWLLHGKDAAGHGAGPPTRPAELAEVAGTAATGAATAAVPAGAAATTAATGTTAGAAPATPAAIATPPAATLRDAAVPLLYLLLFAAVLTRPLHQVELHLVVGALALLSCYLVPLPLPALRARLDWPTLLFIASLGAWQPMLSHTGVDAWLAAQLPALARHAPASLQLGIVALALLVGAVRLVVPGAPAFIVLATGLLPLAPALGMSPWVLGFVLLSVSEGFVLTHQHGVPSHLDSEARALGLQLLRRRLLLANLLAWLLRVLALVASVPWWRQIGVA